MLEVNQAEEQSKVLMEMTNGWNTLLSRCSCAAATYLAAAQTEISIAWKASLKDGC